VNTLLDTLLRPNADTEINPRSCIEWRYEPEKAISHVAIGQTQQAGGQWAENPVAASADIGTLSYAEQLSLPGYSYAQHAVKSGKTGQCDFVRPTRAEVADYLSAYPEAVGIADAVYTATKVDHVCRTQDGFIIGSLGIRCKHLVLASGIFSVNIPPTPLLAPLAQLDSPTDPLLVIGSGFTAADIIISTPPHRNIIHIFQWAPQTRPSPLRGCHQSAYPEYANMYRQMKLAAISSYNAKKLPVRSPQARRKSNPFSQRDWATVYEGLPNAEVLEVLCSPTTNSATVKIRTASGNVITRPVGGLEYVIGRRGTLDYLSPALRAEVLGSAHQTPIDSSSSPSLSSSSLISGRTLRSKADSSLEIAPNIFLVGSLAGDSLIRHAVGGCVFAAGRILSHIPSTDSSTSSSTCSPCSSSSVDHVSEGDAGNGSSKEDGHAGSVARVANGHSDLHVDRRGLANRVDVANAENGVWVKSGWWAGGFGFEWGK
jgi:hypothetical protein